MDLHNGHSMDQIAHAAKKKVWGYVAASSPLHGIPVWDLGGQIKGHLDE